MWNPCFPRLYPGLPTGSPPLGTYKELIKLYKAGKISFENVHILNGNATDLANECEEYEKAIKAAGGIRIFMGGVVCDDDATDELKVGTVKYFKDIEKNNYNNEI